MVYSITKARNETLVVIDTVMKIPEDDWKHDRSIGLIRYFTMEQFTPIKKYILQSQF
jgi:hypothetical protein